MAIAATPRSDKFGVNGPGVQLNWPTQEWVERLEGHGGWVLLMQSAQHGQARLGRATIAYPAEIGRELIGRND